MALLGVLVASVGTRAGTLAEQAQGAAGRAYSVPAPLAQAPAGPGGPIALPLVGHFGIGELYSPPPRPTATGGAPGASPSPSPTPTSGVVPSPTPRAGATGEPPPGEAWWHLTPFNDVRGLAPAPDGPRGMRPGRVLAATAGGLMVWDPLTGRRGGVSFTPARAVAVDATGGVWVDGGTHGPRGASRLEDDGAWSAYPELGDDRARPVIGTIGAAPDGAVWFGATGGVFGAWRLDADGGWRHFSEADGLVGGLVKALAFDGLGGTWITLDPSRMSYPLVRIDAEGMVEPFGAEELGRGYRFLTGAAVTSAGTVWIGSSGGLLRRKAGEPGWMAFDGVYPTDRGDKRLAGIGALRADAEGGVWVAGRGVLRIAPDGSAIAIPPVGEEAAWAEERPGVDAVLSAAADVLPLPGGGLAVGGRSGLAMMDSAGTWSAYAPPDGDAPASVRAIAHSGGHAWLYTGIDEGVGGGGTEGGGLLRRSPDGAWERQPTAGEAGGGGGEGEDGGHASDRIAGLEVDPDGGLWVATDAGASHRDPTSGEWRSFGKADGLRTEDVGAIAFAPDGTPWVGLAQTYDASADEVIGGGPAYRALDGGWVHAEGVGDGVHALAIAPDGGAWMATHRASATSTLMTGLVHRAPDGALTELRAGGVGPITDVILDVAIDRHGRVWLATDHGVEARSVDGEWFNAEMEGAELPGRDVRALALAQGDTDELWVATGGGVARFTLADSSARASIADSRAWTTGDGLSSDDVRCVAIDPDGRPWFGTERGGTAILLGDAPAVLALQHTAHTRSGR